MELNLIHAPAEKIENFFRECGNKEGKELFFETGEYGMVLLHRLVESLMDKWSCSVQNLVPSDTPQPQFVKYMMIGGITITVYYNKDYDNVGERDEQTGFPIKASTLYLKDKHYDEERKSHNQ